MLDKDLKKVKSKVLDYLKKKYTNNKIEEKNLILLNKGQFANATVFRYKDESVDLTIKDFSGSPKLIRDTFGRLSVKIEGNTLKKLSDNRSVAKEVEFLSPYTVSFSFIDGIEVKRCKDISEEFFLTLEKNVKKMHEKDIVHLDLRNLGNIIMGKDGYPYMIDFQSSISVKYLPKFLKNILKKTDLTGVYKCWDRRGATPLDSKRKKELEEFKKIRKFWILRGYPLGRMVKKIKSMDISKVRYEQKYLRICLVVLGILLVIGKIKKI